MAESWERVTDVTLGAEQRGILVPVDPSISMAMRDCAWRATSASTWPSDRRNRAIMPFLALLLLLVVVGDLVNGDGKRVTG